MGPVIVGNLLILGVVLFFYLLFGVVNRKK